MSRLEHVSKSRVSPLVGLSAVAVAVLVTVAATACGKSESQKQADQYADSLCTSISDWQGELNSIIATLTPGAPQQVAREKLNQAGTATVALINEIRGLPVPDTSGATAAKQDVDQLVSSAQSTVNTVEAGVEQLKTSGTGSANVATVVVPIGAQLTTLVADAKSTVTSLEAVEDPFKQAVKNSDACQALQQK